MPSDWTQKFGYIAWANEACERSIASTQDSTEALRLYGHILGAEHIWLTRILGIERPIDVWPTLTLAEAADLRVRNLAELTGLATTATDVVRPVSYQTTTGDAHANPLEDTLLHLFTHGCYHRGQVARAVKAGGGTPVDTDFISWCRSR